MDFITIPGIPWLQIPYSEIELSFARSSGPGGQNVNKVNSKAVLRWSVADSPSLNEDLRFRLMSKLGDRLTGEGDIVLTSDVFRDQLRNKEECYAKLQQLLTDSLKVQKKRKKTKPSKSSQRKVQQSKKMHSQKKKLRRFSADD